MKDILCSFGLPALVVILLFTLLMTGANGEVKAMLAVVVGWIAKTGISKAVRSNSEGIKGGG